MNTPGNHSTPRPQGNSDHSALAPQRKPEAERAESAPPRAGKKLNVLSFGAEAEEDEEAAQAFAADVRFRSAHETLTDDARLRHEEAGVHDAHVAELQARLAREQVCPRQSEHPSTANLR